MRVRLDSSNCIVLVDDWGNTILTVPNVDRLVFDLETARMLQRVNDDAGRVLHDPAVPVGPALPAPKPGETFFPRPVPR